MKKILLFFATMLFCCCSADNEAKAETPTMNKIYITIDGQTQSATLVDNDAIVLYNGSNICIFYDSNSWSYTRLGKIDGLSDSELRTFLKAGENNTTVTLSLAKPTGINTVKSDKLKDKSCYTLQGTLAQAGHKGIIIQNGKKIIRKQ